VIRRTCLSTTLCIVAAAAFVLATAAVAAAASHTDLLPETTASPPGATEPIATLSSDSSFLSLLNEADRLYTMRDDMDSLTVAADLYTAVMYSSSVTDDVRFHCLVRLICLYDFKGRFLLADSDEQYAAFRTCEQYARQLIDLYPDSPEGYYRLALSLGRQARVRGILKGIAVAKPVKENFEKSLEKDPTYVNALMALSRMHLEASSLPLSFGSKAKAREYAERAYSLAPDNPAVMVQMARIEYMLGNRDDAIELLVAVLEMDVPEDIRLDILEDREDAKELLSKCLE
jgi:tetratricopeptide (TPR) repeat protein